MVKGDNQTDQEKSVLKRTAELIEVFHCCMYLCGGGHDVLRGYFFTFVCDMTKSEMLHECKGFRR